MTHPPATTDDSTSPGHRPRDEEGLAAIHRLRQDPVVRRLIEVAAQADASPLHLVGGIIRDAWLDRPTHDVDVVVAGGGRALAERLAKALPARLVPLGGEEFAALRLVGTGLVEGGFEVDLWDRQEMSLEADLARRDVTVNAIALDLRVSAPEGLEDPFGGLQDLSARRLRAVTERSFREDPLRVVRLARLAAELTGFRVEPATAELARANAGWVSSMAAERLRVELERLFAAPGASQGLEVLAQVDLYPALAWPLTMDWPPPGNPQAARTAAREMEALPAALEDLHRRARAAGLGTGAEAAGQLPEVRLEIARWASALLALPDPDEGDLPIPVDDVQREALELLQHRSWASRRTLEPVGRLLEHPAPPTAEGTGERVARERRVLHRLGDLWPTALAWWAARTLGRQGCESEPGNPWRGWEATADRLLDHIVRDGTTILDPPKLLRGQDVTRLTGVEPGPVLGQILAGVRRAQVEGRVRDRLGAEDEARTLARKLSREDDP